MKKTRWLLPLFIAASVAVWIHDVMRVPNARSYERHLADSPKSVVVVDEKPRFSEFAAPLINDLLSVTQNRSRFQPAEIDELMNAAYQMSRKRLETMDLWSSDLAQDLRREFSGAPEIAAIGKVIYDPNFTARDLLGWSALYQNPNAPLKKLRKKILKIPAGKKQSDYIRIVDQLEGVSRSFERVFQGEAARPTPVAYDLSIDTLGMFRTLFDQRLRARGEQGITIGTRDHFLALLRLARRFSEEDQSARKGERTSLATLRAKLRERIQSTLASMDRSGDRADSAHVEWVKKQYALLQDLAELVDLTPQEKFEKLRATSNVREGEFIARVDSLVQEIRQLNKSPIPNFDHIREEMGQFAQLAEGFVNEFRLRRIIYAPLVEKGNLAELFSSFREYLRNYTAKGGLPKKRPAEAKLEAIPTNGPVARNVVDMLSKGQTSEAVRTFKGSSSRAAFPH